MKPKLPLENTYCYGLYCVLKSLNFDSFDTLEKEFKNLFDQILKIIENLSNEIEIESIKVLTLSSFAKKYEMLTQSNLLIDVLNTNSTYIVEIFLTAINNYTSPLEKRSLIPDVDVFTDLIDFNILSTTITGHILNFFDGFELRNELFDYIWKDGYHASETKLKIILEKYCQTYQLTSNDKKCCIRWRNFQNFLFSQVITPSFKIEDLLDSHKFNLLTKYMIDKSEEDIKKWFMEFQREEEEFLNMQFFDTYQDDKDGQIVERAIINQYPMLIDTLEKHGVSIWGKSKIKEYWSRSLLVHKLSQTSHFEIDDLIQQTFFPGFSKDRKADSSNILILVSKIYDTSKDESVYAYTPKIIDYDIKGLIIYDRCKAGNIQCDINIVKSLSIDTRFRRGGLGRILFGCYLLLMKYHNYQFCMLDAVRLAQNFYSRFGFQQSVSIKDFPKNLTSEYNFAIDLKNINDNSLLLHTIHNIPIFTQKWREDPLMIYHDYYNDHDRNNHDNSYNISISDQTTSSNINILNFFSEEDIDYIGKKFWIHPLKNIQDSQENVKNYKTTLLKNFHPSMLLIKNIKNKRIKTY